jgi:hypothetical protein
MHIPSLFKDIYIYYIYIQKLKIDTPTYCNYFKSHLNKQILSFFYFLLITIIHFLITIECIIRRVRFEPSSHDWGFLKLA